MCHSRSMRTSIDVLLGDGDSLITGIARSSLLDAAVVAFAAIALQRLSAALSPSWGLAWSRRSHVSKSPSSTLPMLFIPLSQVYAFGIRTVKVLLRCLVSGSKYPLPDIPNGRVKKSGTMGDRRLGRLWRLPVNWLLTFANMHTGYA